MEWVRRMNNIENVAEEMVLFGNDLCIRNTCKIEYDMRNGMLIKNASFFVDYVPRGICKTHENEVKLG